MARITDGPIQAQNGIAFHAFVAWREIARQKWKRRKVRNILCESADVLARIAQHAHQFDTLLPWNSRPLKTRSQQAA
jgi:hypothetical protein